MVNDQDYPKILFFTSNHCAPCKPVAQMLKKINISMFGKKLYIEKIDIKESINRKIIEEHRITSIPTVIIADKKITGNIQEEEIVDAVLYGFISSVKL
ncbi:MAG: thioredoxin [Promethearchaeota archaeon]|nr:MAG: thioredoxin [Candidatus Lokiarchaeota archaeon]